MSRHTDREESLLAREAAQFIKQEASAQSLITVTRVTVSARGDRATIFVSVLPESEMKPALQFLARQREAFSEHLKAHTRLRSLPRVDFLPDAGEQNRQRLDEISNRIS